MQGTCSLPRKKGLQLRKLVSSSQESNKEFLRDHRSKETSKNFEQEPNKSSVLGLKRKVELDSLEVSLGPHNEFSSAAIT